MRILVTFLCVSLLSTVMVAQFNDDGGFPEKYRSAFLGFGPRTLDTNPGTIVTSYVDESPSMDILVSSTEILDNYNKFGFQLGYKWGKYAGLGHSVIFDIATGQHEGIMLMYSLGYNFPFKMNKSAIVLRPGFAVGFGNFGFDIGKIDNNAGYIEINGKKFVDESLDVTLISQVGVYGAELDVTWLISDHFQVSMDFNYDLSGKNNRPKVKFEAPNAAEGSPSNAEVTIEGDNPIVTYNGERLTTLPYDVSGVRFTLGVAYVWNRY